MEAHRRLNQFSNAVGQSLTPVLVGSQCKQFHVKAKALSEQDDQSCMGLVPYSVKGGNPNGASIYLSEKEGCISDKNKETNHDGLLLIASLGRYIRRCICITESIKGYKVTDGF